MRHNLKVLAKKMRKDEFSSLEVNKYFCKIPSCAANSNHAFLKKERNWLQHHVCPIMWKHNLCVRMVVASIKIFHYYRLLNREKEKDLL